MVRRTGIREDRKKKLTKSYKGEQVVESHNNTRHERTRSIEESLPAFKIST